MTEASRPAADRSWAWMVAFPAAVGAFLGWLGGTLWWRLAGPEGRCSRSGEGDDCIGGLFLLPVALALGVAVSWAVLAWAMNAWMAPTVTLGGSAAAGYLVGVYLHVVSGPDPAPPWVMLTAWGLCYGAVGLACFPGLGRAVRGLVVAVLVTPVTVYLML